MKLFQNALLLVLLPAMAHAQLVNIKNMSAEWVRCGARNAAINGTDLVIYNPAALTHVKEGFSLDIGNQAYLSAPSQTITNNNGIKKYTSDVMSYIHPNLLLSYHQRNWALWGGAFIGGGHPALNYSEGNFYSQQLGELFLANSNYYEVKKHAIKLTSDYYTATAGFSLKANDNLSFAIGGRYIYAIQTGDVETTLSGGSNPSDLNTGFSYDNRASGYGFTLGIHAIPYDRFTISLRLESNASLNFKRKTDYKGASDVILYKDEEYRNDLPGTAAIGFGLELSSKFRMTAEANYYFQQMANWGKTSDGKRISTLAGDAISFGGDFEWKLHKVITWSAGANYFMPMFNDIDAYYRNSTAMNYPCYENLTANGGFAIDVSKGMRINMGFAKSFYPKDKVIQWTTNNTAEGKIKLNNDVMLFALGFDFCF